MKYLIYTLITICSFINMGQAQVTFIMEENANLSNNEYTYVDVTVENFTDIVSFQFAMLWNEDVFKVEAVSNYNSNLSGYGPATTTLPEQTPADDDGTIRMIWFDPVTTANSLPDGSQLFTIKFSHVGNACESSDLIFGDAFPTVVEIIDGGLNQVALVSTPISMTIPGPGCSGIMSCNTEVTVNPNPFNCEVQLTADHLLNGSGYENVTITPSVLDGNNIGQTTNVTVAFSLNGVNDQCEVAVTFEDNISPVVVVEDELVVSLSTDPATLPMARVYAETIDDGSFDNCSSITFSPEYFDFDCSDIGEQTVILEVTDAAGNTNKAWTKIIIEYESPVAIDLTCPEDVIVDCVIDINDPVLIESTLGFGIGTSGCLPVYTDVFDYDANNDGDLSDTFTLSGEEFNERFNIGCNNGPVVRTWSIPGTAEKCDQIIAIREGDVLDGNTMIDWPYSLDAFVSVGENDGSANCGSGLLESSDITLEPNSTSPNNAVVNLQCIDDLCEQPLFDEESVCSLLGVSIETDTFYFEDGDCIKIIQTYTVIDWCNYDPASSIEEGVWEWTVIGKYNDVTPPTVVAYDTILTCNTILSVSATASNLTDPSNPGQVGCRSNDLRYQVLLDINNDFQYEREWNSDVDEDLNTPNDPLWSDDNLADNLAVYGYSIPDVRVGNRGGVDNMSVALVPSGFKYTINIPDNLSDNPNALHRVYWKVSDQCGNVSSVTTYFSVDRSNDSIAPTPYCLNFVTAKLNDADGNGPLEAEVEIWAIDFDAGSFDNCSPQEDLRFSFSDINPEVDPDFAQGNRSASRVFTESDLNGDSYRDYSMKIYVWDENNNSDFCNVNLRITKEGSPCQVSNVFCEEKTVALSNTGTATIFADGLVTSYDNPCNIADIRFSFSPNIIDQDKLNIGCSQKGSYLQDVYVYANGLLAEHCKALIHVTDPLNVCPSSGADVKLKYGNYTAGSNEEVCVELKTDNFSMIDGLQGTFEWDPAVLSYTRTQNYSLTGMSSSLFGDFDAENGKLTYLWFDVSGSTPATVPTNGTLFEVCFDVVGQEGDATSLSHSDTPTPMQVSRGSDALPLTLVNGTFTVGSSNCGPNEDQEKPVPYCVNLSTSVIQGSNTEVELWAIDFNVGSFDNCTTSDKLRYSFSDINPASDPEFVNAALSSKRSFSLDDLEPGSDFAVVRVYVWDEADNSDFCMVNLRIVEDSTDPCFTNTEDNIQWPLAEVSITNPNIVNGEWTPEILMISYGFTEADVYPTYINTTCTDGLFHTYSDVVINISGNVYKILRSWTVLDWYTAKTYTFNQIIRVNIGSTLICDTLPNTAPVGDCDSGHTLDDDVEWPANIMIADHRITPDELEMFSGIPSKDSRPVFYNADAQLYTAEYIDILVSLNTTTLVLDRQWTVGRTDDPGLSWQYTQSVTVDITMFSNLVTVNTISNRPMPNVQLNDQTTTDFTGSAMVMPSEDVNPSYSDLLLNGLDLRDVLHIQRQILQQVSFNNFQLAAADLTKDQTVSTVDIIELIKLLTREEQNQNADWQFIDYTNNSGLIAQVRGHFIGYKSGDVDDSAILDGQAPVWPEQDLSFEDELLNAGETYYVPFEVEQSVDAIGFHVNLQVQTDAVDIKEVTSDYFDNVYWYLDSTTGRLSVLAYDVNSNVVSFAANASIFEIELVAQTNSILGTSLDYDDDHTSYMVTGDDGLIQFNGQLEGGITLNTYDLDGGVTVKVYPNPVVDYMKFDFENNGSAQPVKINILDINGQLILSTKNTTVLDLTSLNSGIYMFHIQYGDSTFTERFVKM